MHDIFLIFIGLMIGILNSLALKWTIKKILDKKSVAVAISSLLIRLFIIATIVYIFLDKKWQNAIFMLIGFTIAKMSFIILEKFRSIKK